MNRQRGSLILYGLIALAIIAGLTGLYTMVYRSGKASVQAEWEKAKAKAQLEEAARQQAVTQIVNDAAAQRKSDDALILDYYTKWEVAKNGNRQPLAVCGAGTGNAGSGMPSTPDAHTGGVRVTWGYVGLRDSIHTDKDGKPLFGTFAGILKAANVTDAATPSPYSLEAILDNDKANAIAANACRADMTRLQATLKRLSDDWVRRN